MCGNKLLKIHCIEFTFLFLWSWIFLFYCLRRDINTQKQGSALDKWALKCWLCMHSEELQANWLGERVGGWGSWASWVPQLPYSFLVQTMGTNISSCFIPYPLLKTEQEVNQEATWKERKGDTRKLGNKDLTYSDWQGMVNSDQSVSLLSFTGSSRCTGLGKGLTTLAQTGLTLRASKCWYYRHKRP